MSDKAIDPLHPEDTVIRIAIDSDTRQCGKTFLQHDIAEFLKERGYENVVVQRNPNHLPYDLEEQRRLGDTLWPHARDKAKKVTIVIATRDDLWQL